MERIAEKYLCQLQDRAKTAGIHLQLPENLAGELAKTSGKQGGARQLRRLVQERVEGPLAMYLLKSGRKNQKIQGILEQDQLQFQ